MRGIYADRVGWFDGNATNLFPLPEKDRAAKLVGLIGGPDQVLARGREALAAREFTWAAELADYVLANDGANAAREEDQGPGTHRVGRAADQRHRPKLLPVLGHVLLRDLPPQ